MQVLIDTNVILDVLMQRSGMEFSGRILQMSVKGKIRGFISASAVTDIYYILNRQIKDRTKTVEGIKIILSLFVRAGILFFLLLWTQGSSVCYYDGERWING